MIDRTTGFLSDDSQVNPKRQWEGPKRQPCAARRGPSQVRAELMRSTVARGSSTVRISRA